MIVKLPRFITRSQRTAKDGTMSKDSVETSSRNSSKTSNHSGETSSRNSSKASKHSEKMPKHSGKTPKHSGKTPKHSGKTPKHSGKTPSRNSSKMPTVKQIQSQVKTPVVKGETTKATRSVVSTPVGNPLSAEERMLRSTRKRESKNVDTEAPEGRGTHRYSTRSKIGGKYNGVSKCVGVKSLFPIQNYASETKIPKKHISPFYMILVILIFNVGSNVG